MVADRREDGKNAQDGSSIPTNLRMMVILEEVARAQVPVTPTEVNQVIGLPKQTIHRLFATLEEEGYLQRSHDGRSFSCGRRLRDLSVNAISSEHIRAVRLAILTRLAEKIGETCNLAIPDRHAMVYLDRVETQWPLRIQLPAGTSVPFHCTASGKMFLSTWEKRRLNKFLGNYTFAPHTSRTLTDVGALKKELSQIEEQGYSTDDEEFMDGMIAVAVPIRKPDGGLFCTLAFHAPTMRMSLDQAKTYLPDLQSAAQELAEVLEIR